MRDYKGKMEKYRIPKSRKTLLMAYCRTTNEERLQRIRDVFDEEFGEDAIIWWLYQAIVNRWTWMQLQNKNVPCGEDSFRVYKARFFWALNRKIFGADFLDEKRGIMEDTNGSG
jgi:hypothetical protein